MHQIKVFFFKKRNPPELRLLAFGVKTWPLLGWPPPHPPLLCFPLHPTTPSPSPPQFLCSLLPSLSHWCFCIWFPPPGTLSPFSPFLLADSHFFSFPPQVACSRGPVRAPVKLDLDHDVPSSLPSSCERISSRLKLLTRQSVTVPWKEEFVLIIAPFPQYSP